MQYRITYQYRVIVSSTQIADLHHAHQIKRAIDNPEWGIEVTIVEVYEPEIPRVLPTVGYYLSWRDGKDVLELQTSESPYGGWSFEEEGYDRNCRLYPRKDGNPHTVLVYATSSIQAIGMARNIRAIFEAQAEVREAHERKQRELRDAYVLGDEEDED